jgi:hypothetical protein
VSADSRTPPVVLNCATGSPSCGQPRTGQYGMSGPSAWPLQPTRRRW